MKLTIPVGATESNVLDDPKRYFTDLILYAPAAIGGVTSVQVAPRRASQVQAADWVTLQSGGADITLTAAKGTPITVAGARSLRLVTTVTVVGADEVYEVTGGRKGR